jgi:hypothetical protein
MDPIGWRPAHDFSAKARMGAIVIGSVVLLAIFFFGLPLRGGVPKVTTPPAGTIYFLSAVDASEHSTAVRTLYQFSAGDKAPHELYTETEPMPGNGVNLDPAPPREWITLLTVAPNGASLGFVDTSYNIQEESRTQTSSVDVMPLRPPGLPQPVMSDLEARHVTSPRALAWAPNSQALVVEDSAGRAWACGLNGTFAPAAAGQSQLLQGDRFPGVAAHAKWQDSLIPTRHLTSMRYAPDHAWVGYTVSNFLLPEDDLYVMRLSDHACFHLPILTSRAAWAWGQ